MDKQELKAKTRQWLMRYIPAEILGTVWAVTTAWVTFIHTHSYLAATASGWVGEGIGFFGYFIISEFLENHRRYSAHPFLKRLSLAIAAAMSNLLVEFLPAEILDNILFRPLLMYVVPQHIKPYAFGFLIGKFLADILFYALAIAGFELRKHWFKR